MIDVLLRVSGIDYEESARRMVPRLVSHCRKKSAPREWEKLLAGLGDAAVPLAVGVLGQIDPAQRGRVTAALFTAYEPQLLESMNRHITDILPARLGGMAALESGDGGMTLAISQTRIDYASLPSSPLFTAVMGGGEAGLLLGAARFALQSMSPDALEKQLVGLMGSDQIKGRLLPRFQETLGKVGLAARVEDMILYTSGPEKVRGPAREVDGLLPDEVEDLILNGVVRYLRQLVG